jgi:DNA-binding NarL/FixJ family response regulator
MSSTLQGKSMDSQRQRARLLIADDHELVAEALKSVLEPEFQVVGIVNDGRALLAATAELRPDVIIVDIGMPLLNGLDAGEQAKQIHRTVKLVYVTVNVSAEVAAEAFRRGASAYVPKHVAATELIAAVREVLKGRSHLSPLITKETFDFLLRTGAPYSGEHQITMRQREILQLLAEGLSMKEVAYTLKIKPGTVAFHKYRIMNALGLKTNAELMQYAIKEHIIAA